MHRHNTQPFHHTPVSHHAPFRINAATTASMKHITNRPSFHHKITTASEFIGLRGDGLA